MGRVSKKRKESVKHIQYVLPIGNGWIVKYSAAKKFTAIVDNKKEAVPIARGIAMAKHRELVVFFKNGNIQEKTSYAV